MASEAVANSAGAGAGTEDDMRRRLNVLFAKYKKLLAVYKTKEANEAASSAALEQTQKQLQEIQEKMKQDAQDALERDAAKDEAVQKSDLRAKKLMIKLREASAWRSEMQQAKQEAGRLRLQREADQNAISMLQSDVASLHGDLSALRAENTSNSQSLADEVHSLRRKVSAQHQENLDLTAQRSSLEDQVAKMKSEAEKILLFQQRASDVESRLEMVELDLEDAQQRLHKKAQEVEQLQMQVDQGTTSAEGLNQQVNSLTSRLDTALREARVARELSEQVERLTEELRGQREQCLILQKDKDAHQQKSQNLQDQVVELQSRLSDVVEEAEKAVELDSSVADLTEKLASTQDQLADVRAQFDAVRSANDALVADGDALEEENRRLQSQLDGLVPSSHDSSVESEQAEALRILREFASTRANSDKTFDVDNAGLCQHIARLHGELEASQSLQEVCREQIEELSRLRAENERLGEENKRLTTQHIGPAISSEEKQKIKRFDELIACMDVTDESAISQVSHMKDRCAILDGVISLIRVENDRDVPDRLKELKDNSDACKALQDICNEQSSKLEESDVNAVSFKRTVSALEGECENLRSDVTQYKDTIDRLRRRVSQVCSQRLIGIDEYRDRILGLEQSINDLTSDRASHISIIAGLEHALNASNSTIHRLEDKIRVSALQFEESLMCSRETQLRCSESFAMNAIDLSNLKDSDEDSDTQRKISLKAEIEQLQTKLSETEQAKEKYGAKARELHQQGTEILEKYSNLKRSFATLTAAHDSSKLDVTRLESLVAAKSEVVETLEKEIEILSAAVVSETEVNDLRNRLVELETAQKQHLDEAQSLRDELLAAQEHIRAVEEREDRIEASITAVPSVPARPMPSPQLSPHVKPSPIDLPGQIPSSDSATARTDDSTAPAGATVDSVAPAGQQPEADASANGEAPQPNQSFFGRLAFWRSSEKPIPRADLTEDTSFYFDQKLGKWVDKNAPEEEKKSAPPPPPRPKDWKSASEKVQGPSAEISSSDSTSRGSSGPNKTAKSQFSAAGGGVGSRYAAFGTDIGFSGQASAATVPPPARRPPGISRTRPLLRPAGPGRARAAPRPSANDQISSIPKLTKDASPSETSPPASVRSPLAHSQSASLASPPDARKSPRLTPARPLLSSSSRLSNAEAIKSSDSNSSLSTSCSPPRPSSSPPDVSKVPAQSHVPGRGPLSSRRMAPAGRRSLPKPPPRGDDKIQTVSGQGDGPSVPATSSSPVSLPCEEAKPSSKPVCTPLDGLTSPMTQPVDVTVSSSSSLDSPGVSATESASSTISTILPRQSSPEKLDTDTCNTECISSSSPPRPRQPAPSATTVPEDTRVNTARRAAPPHRRPPMPSRRGAAGSRRGMAAPSAIASKQSASAPKPARSSPSVGTANALSESPPTAISSQTSSSKGMASHDVLDGDLASLDHMSLQQAKTEIVRLQSELAQLKEETSKEKLSLLKKIQELEAEASELRQKSNSQIEAGGFTEQRLRQQVAEMRTTIDTLRKELAASRSPSPSPFPGMESSSAASTEAARLVDELKGVVGRLEQLEDVPYHLQSVPGPKGRCSCRISSSNFFILALLAVAFAIVIGFSISVRSVPERDAFYSINSFADLIGLRSVPIDSFKS